MKKTDFDKSYAALIEISRAAKFDPRSSDETKQRCYEAAGRLFVKHEEVIYDLLNYVLRNYNR
jgi:hypothetical protein